MIIYGVYGNISMTKMSSMAKTDTYLEKDFYTFVQISRWQKLHKTTMRSASTLVRLLKKASKWTIV